MCEMNFYYWKENGKIVVRTSIMGMLGQRHEHTLEDFKKWKKDIPEKYLIHIANCDK